MRAPISTRAGLRLTLSAILALVVIGMPIPISGRVRAAATLARAVVHAGATHAIANRLPVSASGALAAAAWSVTDIGRLNPQIFNLALSAAACAVRSGSIERLATLTVIDYSLPSTEKRLWVFDLAAKALRYEELVAHGSGSGENLATTFSNEPETHRSSLGLFRTEDTYVGRNGYSLRLRGLDSGFNDRAYERAIVMHGAPYVNEDVVRAQGRLGRSWGCPALRSGVARELIDAVKGSGLLFAYYPDQQWLRSSKYLGDCGSAS